MRNLIVWLAAALAAVNGTVALGQTAGPGTDGAEPMKEALKAGATTSQIFLHDLETYATTDFPGILAWVHGSGATIAALDKDHPTDAWQNLSPEQLITRNAAWWEAYFEVGPGDPGLGLLHGSSLLCAGDAQRAMQVLRIALNYHDLDAGSARFIVSVMQHAGAYMEPSQALVRQGLLFHDKGNFLAAIAKYDAALKIWPRNAWAMYEKGFSIRMNERKEELPVIVADLFERSRKSNPFQWSAWQGTVKDIPGLRPMLQDAKPIWDECLKDLNFRMTDEQIEKLADTLQLSEVDDLALVVRQMLVQHRGKYVPADHPFIARSLRRLVPGDRTEATLARLGGASFKAIRLYEPLKAKEKRAEER